LASHHDSWKTWQWNDRGHPIIVAENLAFIQSSILLNGSQDTLSRPTIEKSKMSKSIIIKDGMYVPKRMHRNPAFRKLTANAISVLLEFLFRRQIVKIGRRDELIIKNNGEIVLTYAEITKKFGIARSTYRSALDQLVILGFIDIAHQGGGMMKDCSKYGISDRWRDYGKKGLIKKSRKKDNRKLGNKKDNWPDRTGRKRKRK